MVQRINSKNLLGGVLMLIIGVGVVFEATEYSIGSLNNMGPGFFPAALGVFLGVLGLLIVVATLVTIVPANQRNTSGFDIINKDMVRGWTCLVLATLFFVVIGDHFGLVPATFAIVFISAMGDKTNSLKACMLLALGTALVGPAIFVYGLNMHFPLFSFGS